MSKYFDIHDILAEETFLPVKFSAGATRLGPLINGNGAGGGENVEPNAMTELPLWLIKVLATKDLVTVKRPTFFGERMQRKLIAGAGCENLRARCPYFYEVAKQYHDLNPEAGHELATCVFNAYKERYHKVAGCAMGLDLSVDATDFAKKLTAEELYLFEGARQAADQGQTWKFDHSAAVAAIKPRKI